MNRFSKDIGVLDMVVPDRDLVAGHFGKAIKRADGVVVVVEDGDVHVFSDDAAS